MCVDNMLNVYYMKFTNMYFLQQTHNVDDYYYFHSSEERAAQRNQIICPRSWLAPKPRLPATTQTCLLMPMFNEHCGWAQFNPYSNTKKGLFTLVLEIRKLRTLWFTQFAQSHVSSRRLSQDLNPSISEKKDQPINHWAMLSPFV